MQMRESEIHLSPMDLVELEISSRPEGSKDDDIVWLCRELGWSERQAAQAMGVHQSSVHRALVRAKRKAA